MGQHLITMPGGKGTIEMRGPSGRLKYLGEGRFDIRGRSQKAYKNIGMIAGGSGLTPMLQILRAIAHSPKDRTQVTFIFANQEGQFSSRFSPPFSLHLSHPSHPISPSHPPLFS